MQKEKYITFFSNKRENVLDTCYILYAVAENSKTEIHTTGGEMYETRMPLAFADVEFWMTARVLCTDIKMRRMHRWAKYRRISQYSEYIVAPDTFSATVNGIPATISRNNPPYHPTLEVSLKLGGEALSEEEKVEIIE